MKKRNMIKSIATVAAVSAGVLFAGSQSASANTVKHNVVEGDTLNKLSKQYGVSVQDLAQANAIKDINKIYVGEVFTIADDGQVSVSNQNTVAAPAESVAPVQNTAPAVKATAPVAVQQPVAASAQPVAAAPAQPAVTTPAPTQAPALAASSANGNDEAAKAWIAARESGGNYSARNGQYVGKYQLSDSYLNGDYSPANQEAVANNYVTSRYGSWSGAQAFWQSHGWY